MADYDWREFKEETFGRFPQTAIGFNRWSLFAEVPGLREFDFTGQTKQIKCPRVFISHKQADEEIALRIAWLAVQETFEFWLDVLDPPLQNFLIRKGNLSATDEARITAAIIEMGLINCTHVIAVITEKARPSRWIPYEYGRIKDNKSLIGSTACWISHSERTNFPEYLHLGNISYTEQDVRNWLRQELTEWNLNNPHSQFCHGGKWLNPIPTANLDNIE